VSIASRERKNKEGTKGRIQPKERGKKKGIDKRIKVQQGESASNSTQIGVGKKIHGKVIHSSPADQGMKHDYLKGTNEGKGEMEYGRIQRVEMRRGVKKEKNRGNTYLQKVRTDWKKEAG